jgi:DMSO/TMAO reductase YedYZ heme-binding membrane subunit
VKAVALRLAFWGALYLALALLPLGVAMLGESATGRGFLVELGVGLGIAGYAMLALQFLTTTRFRWVAPSFGTDAKIHFHRETGILAFVFVLAHPILLFFADRRFLDFLNPWADLPRAAGLSLATVALILLLVLPLWRAAFRMSYEWWRLTHGLPRHRRGAGARSAGRVLRLRRGQAGLLGPLRRLRRGVLVPHPAGASIADARASLAGGGGAPPDRQHLEPGA